MVKLNFYIEGQHMEHSITPYTLRCFNAAYTAEEKKIFHDRKSSKHYMPTNQLMGNDLFYLLKDFLENNAKENKIIEDKKIMYKVEGLVIDEDKRLIYGYIQKGTWGLPALIQDAQRKRPDYSMSHLQAAMLRHFFYVYLPLEQAEGICLFHSIGINGIKTIFEDEFKQYFQLKLPSSHLQYNPLQYSEIYKEWENAVAKKIIVNKFNKTQSDRADTINNAIGENEQTLVIKIKNPVTTLINFLLGGNQEKEMIEILENDGSQVKGEFELDGKKRTLRLGKQRSAKCDILIDSNDVRNEEGVLNHEELLSFCERLTQGIIERIYP